MLNYAPMAAAPNNGSFGGVANDNYKWSMLPPLNMIAWSFVTTVDVLIGILTTIDFIVEVSSSSSLVTLKYSMSAIPRRRTWNSWSQSAVWWRQTLTGIHSHKHSRRWLRENVNWRRWKASTCKEHVFKHVKLSSREENSIKVFDFWFTLFWKWSWVECSGYLQIAVCYL